MNIEKISRREFLNYFSKAILSLLLLKFKGDKIVFKNEIKKYIKEIKETVKENIEKQINQELKFIDQILQNRQWEKVIENKFLAASFYWSDNFWQKIKKANIPKNENQIINNQNEPTPQQKLYFEIHQRLTPEIKKEYFDFLKSWAIGKLESKKEQLKNKKLEHKFCLPLKNFEIPEGPNHPDALDIFTQEGEKIFSITNGIVIVADKNWKENDYFSSHSMLGGNGVIIFDPENNQFLRYAHLNQVYVNAGDVVLAGDVLGTVGHTGLNAQKPGHGNHLHLEINKLKKIKNEYKIIPLKTNEIKQLIYNILKP